MNKLKSLSPAVKLIIIVLAGVGGVIFSREISKGVQNGLFFCADALIPSLFPFMVLSSAACKTLSFKGKRFNNITKKLFGISGNAFFAVITGIFGGYPVGAVSIRELYKSGAISKSEAEKTAYTAFGAGPAFLISFVGIRLLNSIEIGVILLTSQIAAVITISFFSKHYIKHDYNSNNEIKIENHNNILVTSVSDAVKGVMEMCGMVCLFSAILSLTEKHFGVYANLLLEVTSACNKLCAQKNVTLLAFAAGFGGICVHFQVFQILKDIGIRKPIFFLWRIIQGILTSAFTVIQLKIFNITVPVFSSVSGTITPALSGSVIGSIVLILTGVSFLYSISGGKYVRNSRCSK